MVEVVTEAEAVTEVEAEVVTEVETITEVEAVTEAVMITEAEAEGMHVHHPARHHAALRPARRGAHRPVHRRLVARQGEDHLDLLADLPHSNRNTTMSSRSTSNNNSLRVTRLGQRRPKTGGGRSTLPPFRPRAPSTRLPSRRKEKHTIQGLHKD